MAPLYMWVFILHALSYWNCASGCTWMKTQKKGSISNFHILSNSSISHLELACKNAIRDDTKLNLEFPNKQYSHITQLQSKDHIRFILRTLKNVMRVYDGEHEKSDCDPRKLQIFLLDIHRQVSELEQCATHVVVTDLTRRISKKMDMHFKSLISHLKNMDYSTKSWNDITGVVLRHLRRLDLLAINTKNHLQALT
ncbi:interferon a3-like [Brachyhypopomus gauderio]|uniref:interferon a3-like n=1 Tax=Brachyhypopomus gauderio TaxID=698409 RepID=UPI0040439263